MIKSEDSTHLHAVDRLLQKFYCCCNNDKFVSGIGLEVVILSGTNIPAVLAVWL